jgi:hypothetical protein
VTKAEESRLAGGSNACVEAIIDQLGSAR